MKRGGGDSVSEGAPELTAGGGARRAYLVLVSFLAAMAVSGLAVHNSVNARGRRLPAAASLTLTPATIFLAAVKSDAEKASG